MRIQHLLTAGLALGTAWAVRGQFGHEHGAAWAGAIGALTLILISGREDWKKFALPIALAGGVGWGLGGMMSYGILVGYGKGTDWGNVYYGLTMLGVVGALYGFTGGAWMGLSLSRAKNPWPQVIVESTVGAILSYFFLVEQFGYLMTPPRSELWAACLGISLATAWYLYRNEHIAALKLGGFTALGAGLGFGLGNFFQVLGNIYEVPFNMWNVMEYTLGFCGGIGMYYGLITSEWPELSKEERGRNLSWFFLCIFIPLVMWEQNATLEKISKKILSLREDFPSHFAYLIQYLPAVLILILGLNWRKMQNVRHFYFQFFGLYIALSLFITGAFFSTHRPEQYLYLVNLLLVYLLLKSRSATFQNKKISNAFWIKGILGILLLFALLAWIAIQLHENALSGAHNRF